MIHRVRDGVEYSATPVFCKLPLYITNPDWLFYQHNDEIFNEHICERAHGSQDANPSLLHPALCTVCPHHNNVILGDRVVLSGH